MTGPLLSIRLLKIGYADVGVLIALAQLDDASLDVALLAPVGEVLAREVWAVAATNGTQTGLRIFAYKVDEALEMAEQIEAWRI